MPRVTTLTQTKGLRRGLDLKVGAGLNVLRVKKPTRLNKIWCGGETGGQNCKLTQNLIFRSSYFTIMITNLHTFIQNT